MSAHHPEVKNQFSMPRQLRMHRLKQMSAEERLTYKRAAIMLSMSLVPEYNQEGHELLEEIEEVEKGHECHVT